VVEDFKLLTGTFVSVGNLRIAALAAASPVLMDAVVCGEGRDYVGLLAWPQAGPAREVAGLPECSLEDLCRSRELAEFIRAKFSEYNREHPASSTRVERVILLAEPPSMDANEITDKGYVNQRATLQRRAALVEALFADRPGQEVIVCR
jgi:feruloyl-CoA synthase